MYGSLWVVLALCAECALGVQVETEYGIVEGETIELVDPYHGGISVNTFLSIPFARPPVGEFRFLPPEEPEGWDDVFQAKHLSSICIQDPVSVMWLTHPFWNDIEEDCLTLTIYTPADMSGQPYPVMVWMFGGGYQAGASIQYPGHFLAAQDVVVVVPNYRLGIFGFAYSGDEHAPGNMGLLDQNLALHFVQENIENFGGDPNMVTIFGQSAGAGSCGMHLVAPQSSGREKHPFPELFHQVILESGSELAFWAYNGPDHEPENYLEQVAEQLDCPTDDTEEMVECLRTKSTLQLRTTDFNCTEGKLCLGFAPVVDGEDGFIPDVPAQLRLREEFSMVPEMIGMTQEDAFLYLLALGPEIMERGPNRTEFQSILRTLVDHFEVIIGEDAVEDVYQAFDFYYTPWPHIDDGDRNRYQLGMLMTDIAFGVTADTQVKDHTEHAPTYFYVYNYVSDNATILPDFMGTPHMLDVPYVWGFPFLRHNPEVQNQTEIIDVIGWIAEDEEYAYYMATLWTNFAKYGNPTPEPVQPPNEFEPASWPEFSNEELHYMYIGQDTCESREDYRQHQYAFWREYLPYVSFGFEGLPELKDIGAILHMADEQHGDTGCLNGAECPEELLDFLSNQMQDYMEKLKHV